MLRLIGSMIGALLDHCWPVPPRDWRWRLRRVVLLLERFVLVELGGHREPKGQPVGGRPVIGPVLDLGLEDREQRRLAGAVAAAHNDAAPGLAINEAQRLIDRT